jgi:hypothetical protein
MKSLTLAVSMIFVMLAGYSVISSIGFLGTSQASVQVAQAQAAPHIAPWPPIVGRLYPDLQLIDQEGQPFRLSALMGKVILLEPIGMTCPACQAFSGAHDVGPFGGGVAGGGLPSLHKLLPQYARGLKLPRRDVVVVQLLLYDMKYGAPSAKDAQEWAQHFGFKKGRNEIVAVSPYDLRSDIAYNLVPGFHLIDKKFILRSDSTGHHPKDNLYTKLFPMVPYLLK